MKLSQALFRQHLGFQFKKHWLVQGKRKIIDTGLEDYLKSKGIPVQDALEFIKEKKEEKPRIDITGPYEPPKPEDENHPNFKYRPCFTLKPNNVLLEGISQAQVITKTIIAEDRLPSKIEELAEVEAPKYVHNEVKKAILSATVFDCEQEKLPKIKDPKRPAQNFPRLYGITDKRRTQILSNRLLQIIERNSDYEGTQAKYIHNDLETKAVFDKEDELFQFHEVSGVMITSSKPLKHDVHDGGIPFVQIPDLYPVNHTVTLPPSHFYNDTSSFPIRATVSVRHPHTTWLHHEASAVTNIYETPVLPHQLRGRSLTHAFAVAAAYAQQVHGEAVKDLPEPIYLNCIQTDGRTFDLGILKLVTLNLDGTSGPKNVWYCKHDLNLYGSCKYLAGIPTLEKYDPKVYQYLNAIYNC